METMKLKLCYNKPKHWDWQLKKGGKWSVTEIYLAASGDVEKDDEKNPKVYEYDEFCEIVDIVYTFASKWWQ